jgi:very-short-patch-repair endonuclease
MCLGRRQVDTRGALWTAPALRSLVRHDARVPVAPRRPAELQGRVFRGSAVVAAGILTPRELRSRAWQRILRDVYACAELPITHELRAVAAARLLVPGSVVTGRSAAVLWGLPLAGRDDDVELAVPPGSTISAVPGLRVRRRVVDGVTSQKGVRTSAAATTAVDLARSGPLDEAVAVLDRFVAAGVADLAAVRAAAALASGRGCRQVRTAAALADGLAGSPQETRLRLLLHRSQLPQPVAQHVVRDAAGAFVARVDFGWPDRKVAVEYEGRWHGESPQQVAADRRRLNRLRAAGWTVVFVTAEDLRRPASVVALIAAELAR